MRLREFARLREERCLYPFSMTGKVLNLDINLYVQRYA